MTLRTASRGGATLRAGIRRSSNAGWRHSALGPLEFGGDLGRELQALPAECGHFTALEQLVRRGLVEQLRILFDGEGQNVRLGGIGDDEEGKAPNDGGNVVTEPPGARRVDLEIEAWQPADDANRSRRIVPRKGQGIVGGCAGAFDGGQRDQRRAGRE